MNVTSCCCCLCGGAPARQTDGRTDGQLARVNGLAIGALGAATEKGGKRRRRKGPEESQFGSLLTLASTQRSRIATWQLIQLPPRALFFSSWHSRHSLTLIRLRLCSARQRRGAPAQHRRNDIITTTALIIIIIVIMMIMTKVAAPQMVVMIIVVIIIPAQRARSICRKCIESWRTLALSVRLLGTGAKCSEVSLFLCCN